MEKRDLSLAPRIEGVRNPMAEEPPVQFSLDEILRHFSDGIAEVKAQHDIADLLCGKGDLDGCMFIRRSQVAMAEGLLDFYIHEMSKYCLFRMFTGHWDRSEKYPSIMVPMGKVEEAISTTGSKDWFFSYVNERFSRDVFLSKESMREQLNLIGIGFGQTMARAFPSDKDDAAIKQGSRIVEELFRRRNRIAHQYDRSHATAEKDDITKRFVCDYIGKIEALVAAMYAIAKEKG